MCFRAALVKRTVRGVSWSSTTNAVSVQRSSELMREAKEDKTDRESVSSRWCKTRFWVHNRCRVQSHRQITFNEHTNNQTRTKMIKNGAKNQKSMKSIYEHPKCLWLQLSVVWVWLCICACTGLDLRVELESWIGNHTKQSFSQKTKLKSVAIAIKKMRYRKVITS